MRNNRGFSLIIILVALVIIAVIFFGWRVHVDRTNKNLINAGKACAAVITRAKNNQTGEIKDFPDPCSVPKDWTTVTQN